ncbi:hypothetical protein M0805_009489 [Coniferiporia weirii]|nr:hypothetical protein M0805_009489 [Coniferiporia weirii]
MAPVATSNPVVPDISSLKVGAKSNNIDFDEAAVSPSSTSLPRPPSFADKHEERAYLKFRLAQAFRIFGKLGYDEGVAGHITVRDPIKSDCFWVNPFGLHFSLIQPGDLLLVDHAGKILDESGPTRLLNTAAFAIHSAIHAARPDVLCAAHSHSLYGRAYSALGRELDMITQDSCAFYRDHTVYKQFNGVVLAEEEGRKIAETLGKKKNHGLLVATPSIEATLFYFVALEKSCHVQLMADAAGKTVKIGDEEAADTYKTVGSSFGGWFSGRPAFQLLEANEGVKFEYRPE